MHAVAEYRRETDGQVQVDAHAFLRGGGDDEGYRLSRQIVHVQRVDIQFMFLQECPHAADDLARRASLRCRMSARMSRSSARAGVPDSMAISAASALCMMAPSGWFNSWARAALISPASPADPESAAFVQMMLGVLLRIVAPAALEHQSDDEQALNDTDRDGHDHVRIGNRATTVGERKSMLPDGQLASAGRPQRFDVADESEDASGARRSSSCPAANRVTRTTIERATTSVHADMMGRSATRDEQSQHRAAHCLISIHAH